MQYKYHIRIGYECGDREYCDKADSCSYAASWTTSDRISHAIKRFFSKTLKITLPEQHFVLFYRRWARLSGTPLCPYKKSPCATCSECKHAAGPDLEYCRIKYKDRIPHDLPSEYWGCGCGKFEFADWAIQARKDALK